MIIDKITKLLLAAIALALWMILLTSWLQPMPVRAQEVLTSNHPSFSCTGKLTANAYGGVESMVGGYSIKVDCD